MGKKLLKFIFILFSKYSVGLFYSRKYLNGKYFDNCVTGWKWAWRSLIYQKILGINRQIKFPVSHLMKINSSDNVIFNNDDLNNFQNIGCYFQNFQGKIFIGKGTWIAPNVGIITSNHDINNLSAHVSPKNVTIGEKCWIGMNSVILPGVTLKNHTIVGAGSVVAKSFEEENIIIAGNPAHIIRRI
jgi:acetyltransferase-like isoleucine patch superfamily enzyme